MLNILIVDDEPHARDGMKQLLETAKVPVLLQTAEDGEEGLAKACQMPPDILITDIRMPHLNGLEMIKALSEKGIRIPRIYLITGYSEFSYAQQAIHYGVTEYLLKPVATKTLLQLISRDATALDKLPANISLDGRRLMLVSEEENEAFTDFLQHHRYPQLLAAVVYMGQDRHLPDKLKAELMRRKDVYVITLADRHYRGILIGLQDGGEDTAVYNLQILMSATPELTLCHTTVLPDSGIDWYALFQEVTQAIAMSLPLDSHFFPLAQVRSLPEIRVADDTFYRAKLHQFYAQEDYAACRELILQKLRTLCRQRCTPNDIRLLAATSLYKLNLPGETNAKRAEERHVEATNRVSAAKTQKELFGAVNDYFTGVEGYDGTQDYSRLVTLALREVRHRFSEPLTLQYMASALKITPQYLNRLFTRELGMTYNDYLTRHRLEKACEMLKHRDLHINQIAQSVGYTDAKYFCTLFKRMLNITPGQYRAMSGRH